ncbi:unnamed protein product [Rotaria magnacalcarata]|uniref:Uncharacterized protein n=1 Tax=Rotaria magnacalcarata TaxID=392030 RepID=A0A820KMF3_9BILA|nr:unnamed protein product [Rotaria magnacalcarata]
MLMPIEGYEKKPLVTLEEAVEPIVPYVPDVQRKVYIAKMKCAKLSPGNLSIDEAASINLYSMEWGPQDGTNIQKERHLVDGDFEKDEVRRYQREESKGTVIAGGNGSGNRLDQLSGSYYYRRKT